MNQDNDFFRTPFQKGDKKFFSCDSDLETLSDTKLTFFWELSSQYNQQYTAVISDLFHRFLVSDLLSFLTSYKY